MPQRTAVTPETVTAWTARLTTEAEGLDFNDPEDRAVFRTRVANATETMYCWALVGLARHFGREPMGRSRTAAARALADAWIDHMTGRHTCKAAAC